MSRAEQITRQMGGDWHGSYGTYPGEGHSKKDRSVSIKDAPDKPEGVVINCHATGDDWRTEMDRLRRVGLVPEFAPAKQTETNFKRPRSAGTSYFEFQDPDGVTVCRKVRFDKADGTKDFTWQHPDGQGGWQNGRGRDPLFYNLPGLLAAPADAIIYIGEGEQKADKLASWGLVATSSKDLPDDLSPLEGRTVVILPDNDAKGAGIASSLAARLEGVAERVLLVDLPGLPRAGDIMDWDGGRADLATLVKKALTGAPHEPDAPPPLPGEAGPDQWEGTFAPPRQFMLKDWIVRSAAGLLGGEDGVGKSLLAQQMAACAAAGLPFLGLSIERCRAAYITFEDPQDELQRRQEDINAALGITMADLRGWLTTYSLKGEIGNELGTFDQEGRLRPTARYAQVRRAVLDFGAELVFIDNAAHVFPGNENARHDVAAFLGLLERLSIEIDGAVILLAHPNKQHSQGNKKGNEYSGTTGWSAHVRNRLFLDWNAPEDGLPADPDERVLRRSKANYAARGAEIVFRWHQWAFVRDEDLPLNLSAELAAVSRANAENEIFLRCLDKASEERRTVSPSRSASNYAPRLFAKMPIGKGFKIAAFEAAMQRLLHLGEIANDQPIYKRDNRAWARGLGRAQTPAQTVHEPGAQTRTEVAREPAEVLHKAARTAWPIDKSIPGAAHEAAAPVETGGADV